MFQYPRRWSRIVGSFAIFLLVLNLAEYLLEWVRAIYVNIYFKLPQAAYVPFLDPYHNIFPNIYIAHLGLLATLLAARAVAFLTPRITIEHNGLLMETRLSTRLIPYRALRDVRSVEMPNGRFIVFVHSTKGLPFQGWLATILFGRLLWRGFLLTSDLDGFDRVVAAVVGELRVRYGEDKFPAHFCEQQPGWLLTLLNAPRAALHDLSQAEVIEITPEQAGLYMASVALSLAIPALLASLIHLQPPIGAIVLFVLGLLEWPLVSLYLSAIPISELKEMDFQEAIRIYPLTQLPRWAPGLVLTLLVVAGAPAVLLLVAIFGVIAVDGYMMYLLTKEWFHVEFPEALLGMVVTVIYQLIIYEAMLIFMPK